MSKSGKSVTEKQASTVTNNDSSVVIEDSDSWSNINFVYTSPPCWRYSCSTESQHKIDDGLALRSPDFIRSSPPCHTYSGSHERVHRSAPCQPYSDATMNVRSDEISCGDSRGEVSSSGCSSSTGSSLVNLEAFGDALRHNMTSRHEAKQVKQQSASRRLIPRCFWDRSRRSTNEQINAAGNELKEISDDKSVSSTVQTTSFDEEEVAEQNATRWLPNVIAGWLLFALSWFILTPSEDEDEERGLKKTATESGLKPHWKWNWDRIIKVLSVVVGIEVLCVACQFLAYLRLATVE